MKVTTKLWIGIAMLITLTPLGLLIPGYFKSGTAWGEWSNDEVKGLVGYIPKGLQRLSSLWNAPLPDYNLKGWEGKGLNQAGFAYIISAIVGVILTVGAVFLISKLLIRKSE